jgi:HD-GYP domain-containing protein (c-di-GMP phosphodiesterase class II)
VRTLRERSHETGQHTQRLRRLVMELGHAIGLTESQLDELSLLAALHDIGKIGIPDDILMKPGPLSAKEWKVMLKHAEIGFRIAQSFHALAHISDAILAHHERWDGTGYPQGLKSDRIPLIARILSIVDAYDVMTHGRSYQKPVSPGQALEELRAKAGTQFDPELVKIFVDKIPHAPGDTAREEEKSDAPVTALVVRQPAAVPARDL